MKREAMKPKGEQEDIYGRVWRWKKKGGKVAIKLKSQK